MLPAQSKQLGAFVGIADERAHPSAATLGADGPAQAAAFALLWVVYARS